MEGLMASMTNLLVKDDTTTTVVEHTFVPVTDTPNPFWRTLAAGVPLEGCPRLNLTSERLKSGDYKLTVKLELPVMETLGASGTSMGYVAPPKVAYVNTGIYTMFVNARSTLADRANLAKMLAGLVSGASSTTSTGVLDQSSAADAWKNSVLPVTQFLTSLVVPN
jgi:hypothetical protein